MRSRYRVNVWLAFADFFGAVGLLTLGLYGGMTGNVADLRKKVQDLENQVKDLEDQLKNVMKVPRKAQQLLTRIYVKLKDEPEWRGKIRIKDKTYSMVIESALLFDFDERTVPPGKREVLRPLARAIQEIGPFDFREFNLVVTGHTDDYERDKGYNLDLSQGRAQSVANELVRFGLDPAQFAVLTRGVGPTDPVEDNCDPPSKPPRYDCESKGLRPRPKKALAPNRRIELTLAINPAAIVAPQQ